MAEPISESRGPRSAVNRLRYILRDLNPIFRMLIRTQAYDTSLTEPAEP